MSEETPMKPAEGNEDKSVPTPDVLRGGAWRWVVSQAKKPVTGIVAVIVVALTATFSSGLQNLFGGLLPDGWDEPGSGIKVVDVRRQPLSGPVLIPETAAATEFDDMTDARKSVNDPDWQVQHEWYAVGQVTWEVTLVGRHSDAVVITDLRPERTGPCTQKLAEGALVEDIPQGEGRKIELKTAIDANVPELTSADDGSAYFDGGTVTLAKGETVVISIQATSAAKTCQWVLEADYVDHGKRETMTIKAPGDRLFGITGPSEGHPYELAWSTACAQAMTPEDWAARMKDQDYCPSR
jgi:hypothetical protein